MLYSLGTIKAVNRNDRFTSEPAVRFASIGGVRLVATNSSRRKRPPFSFKGCDSRHCV
jgi:hypothetical protein